MGRLDGRVALVTGASRGIGRGTALRFAEEGADVIINYVSSKSNAESVAEEISSLGRNAYVIKCDVSQEDDINSMMNYIRTEIGQLDIIVSNAATGGFRPLMSAGINNFQAAFGTNTLPMILLVQAAKDLLEKSRWRGKVVGISSHGSHKALEQYALIGASKAALEAIVRHWARELGEKINFNIVKAGLVDTDSGRRLPHADLLFQEAPKHACVGNRLLVPRDVANAILFLCTEESDMVQGSILLVDGGADICS
ncbi:MAG: SDR family oxidoreductase [Planctomycetia bacterium]|nr:SDR family oxidoreductase [Planctomycetia bacterium]